MMICMPMTEASIVLILDLRSRFKMKLKTTALDVVPPAASIVAASDSLI